MCHAVVVGIGRLHVCSSKDRGDPILQIAGLVVIQADRRIGQAAIPAFIVILVESNDEKAVVCLCPLVIGIEILLQPGISYRDAVFCDAVCMMILVRDDKGDCRQ